MKCSNCGKEVPTSSVFCHYCGCQLGTGNHKVSNQLITDGKQNPKELKVLILILCIIIVGLAIFSISEAKNSSSLEKRNTEMQEEIKGYEQKVNSLTIQNDTLEVKNKNLSQQLFKEQDNRTQGKTVYSAIVGFFKSSKHNTYKKNWNYTADSELVVVKKGETATLPIQVQNIPTFYATADNTNVKIDWGEWNSQIDTSLMITGVTEGLSMLTFSDEANNPMFYVLVIVIDY